MVNSDIECLDDLLLDWVQSSHGPSFSDGLRLVFSVSYLKDIKDSFGYNIFLFGFKNEPCLGKKKTSWLKEDTGHSGSLSHKILEVKEGGSNDRSKEGNWLWFIL